jgi:formate hydrogenlyase transcriptional activator
MNFEEIVGESDALKRVLNDATRVAPSDATVLILGETGTGKELLARAIHRMSLRQAEGFIKLNCASLPASLLERELFGYGKGSFPGAVSDTPGRLELADNGTFFLDEIGELPLALQPKLLRVLQNGEFERLGSTRTVRVNVRLIAATDHDLSESVAENRLRSDLLHRLSVSTLRMPPLRERSGDIPLLVKHFVRKFSRSMDKRIETIPNEQMNAMTNWSWPGNVRDLERFIERSVTLTEGSVLWAPVNELSHFDPGTGLSKDLDLARREYILQVLRETGGVTSGPHGAALRLGLKRNTLQSIMQRLGITPEDYKD